MGEALTSPEIQAFANGFPVTLLHFALTMAILVVGAAIYMGLTPHREIALVREGNRAAAISLGGVLLGLALPLGVSLHASTSAVDLALWGAATLMVQLLVFRVVDLLLPHLPGRIQSGDIAAALALCAAKLASAVILAAAVSG